MAKKMEVYKCELCGNVALVLDGADGELICCGQPMALLEEKTADQGKEKHVPVVSQDGNKVCVKVGDVEHPMLDNHFIQWIEVQTDKNKVYRKFLNPGEKPEACFTVDGSVTSVRQQCNLHGLWKA